MRMMGEGGWKKSAIAVVTSLGLAFSVWPMDLVHADKKSELEKKLDDVQKNQAQKEKEIAELKKEIDDHKRKLSSLEEELEKAKTEERKKKKVLKEAEEELDRYDDKYKESVRSMYIHSGTNQMQVLLESKSFGEFLARYEVLRLILKQNYGEVKKYYERKEKAEKAEKEVKKARGKVEKKTETARKEYDKMVALMEENQDKLSSLKHEEGDYRKELAELNLEHLKAGSFPYQGPLSRPAGGRVSSGYGYRGSEFHTGIDFANGQGSPIYAAANGRVIRAQSCTCGYGYYIMIDHGGGIFSLYAHMYSWQSQVAVGNVVKKGQRIASIGNNGRSTGPHLHFEVHEGRPGNYVNPYKYMR
ncbi:Peptidase family M23 [Kroppenstedtia eburnea]|uniref:Peptidase family M23 n=2 Tax=Kroppenstedtia eburnea TaxID=714067 RepID=A0A1N7ING0_9BACL|nr:peptidoglycan DD-metalloendopeptidase family protein [Kroppenstedtia eburnea]SIS38627.1 Peptidase family M23 [Kroppenstedtia eburnea]